MHQRRLAWIRFVLVAKELVLSMVVFVQSFFRVGEGQPAVELD